MGCFNMKCALTNLPVTYNDEVVVLFGRVASREEGEYTGGFYYQPHYFNLITTPIYAKYNDYGWFDDAERDSLRVAQEFLKTCGYDEAAKALNGDHWNDVLEEMTVALNEGVPEGLQRDVDYTFIHREAWNKLVEYGRLRNSRVHKSITFNGDVEAEKKEFEATLTKHGLTDIKWTKYEHQKNYWIEAQGSHEMNFNLGMDILAQNLEVLPSVDDDEEIQELMARTDLSPEEMEKKLSNLRRLIRMMRDDYDYDSLKNWQHDKLSWYITLKADNIPFNRAPKLDPKKTLAIIDQINKDQDFRAIVLESYIFLRSLIDNQIVVRGQTDLPTQSQESTYWGHLAIHHAVKTILTNAAKDRADYADDDEEGDPVPDDPLEALAYRELRSKW